MNIIKMQELSRWDKQLKLVRTATLGSMFVKALGKEALPDPSNLTAGDFETAEDRIKHEHLYQQYLNRAEFDGFTGQTLRIMAGKMAFDKATFEVPQQLEYLKMSADGDGLTLSGLVENCFQNVAQVKWHIVLCHWVGSDKLPDNPSLGDVKRAKMRCVFKEYSRESVYWYDYKEINGVNQLSLLVLRQESTYTKKTSSGISEEKQEEFLILGINDAGNYYQELIVRREGIKMESESIGEYEVKANGKPLNFIPVFIVSDEELTTGKLPEETGFLGPISDLEYHRYNVSAKRKSALNKFDPTIFIENMSMAAWENTKEMNGRSAIEMCGINILGSNEDENSGALSVNMLSPAGSLADYFVEDEKSLERLRMLGASIDAPRKKNQTATEANIEASKQNAFLGPCANSLERMVLTLFLYAGIFEGLWTQDDLETNSEQIQVKLNRDFAQIKGSPEEVNTVINLYAVANLIGEEQAIQMIIDLGWLKGDAEELVRGIESRNEI